MLRGATILWCNGVKGHHDTTMHYRVEQGFSLQRTNLRPLNRRGKPVFYRISVDSAEIERSNSCSRHDAMRSSARNVSIVCSLHQRGMARSSTVHRTLSKFGSMTLADKAVHPLPERSHLRRTPIPSPPRAFSSDRVLPGRRACGYRRPPVSQACVCVCVCC